MCVPGVIMKVCTKGGSHVMTVAETGMMCFEDGGRTHKGKERQQPREDGTGQEPDSPLTGSKRASPTHALILAPEDSLQTSDLQNRKRINLRCFKPLGLR